MSDNSESVISTPSIKQDIVFKEPSLPVLKVKRKNKVLDEDAYLLNMGKIIERDFFPDLKKLRAQNDYLDAVERNDTTKIREICAKYTSGSRIPTERLNSPATFETPIDPTPSEDQVLLDGIQPEKADKTDKSNADDLKQISLNQYLANYTSEDNQSFEDMIEESELKRRQKYPWLYKDESSNSEALEHQLTLPDVDEQLQPKKKSLNLDTWGYKNRNYIMYVPDGVDLTVEEKVEMAKRTQEVVHNNTRLKVNPFDEIQNKEKIQGLAQQQVKSLDGKIGLDGKELVPRSPKINGYGFVKTPSPAPGIRDSPLMTWGEIEGTPFRLDGGDTPIPASPGPSFWIPEPPKREKLAHKLADKANEQHRDRKKKAMEAAKRQLTSPRHRPATLDRLATMSPAAQKFASTHLKKSLATDKALSAWYSPSPKTSGSSTPRLVSGSSTPRTPRTPAPITTDNLLQIKVPQRPQAEELLKVKVPERPRASDFFI